MNLTDKLLEISNDVSRLVREYNYLSARQKATEERVRAFLIQKELMEDFQKFLEESDKGGEDGEE